MAANQLGPGTPFARHRTTVCCANDPPAFPERGKERPPVVTERRNGFVCAGKTAGGRRLLVRLRWFYLLHNWKQSRQLIIFSHRFLLLRRGTFNWRKTWRGDGVREDERTARIKTVIYGCWWIQAVVSSGIVAFTRRSFDWIELMTRVGSVYGRAVRLYKQSTSFHLQLISCHSRHFLFRLDFGFFFVLPASSISRHVRLSN